MARNRFAPRRGSPCPRAFDGNSGRTDPGCSRSGRLGGVTGMHGAASQLQILVEPVDRHLPFEFAFSAVDCVVGDRWNHDRLAGTFDVLAGEQASTGVAEQQFILRHDAQMCGDDVGLFERIPARDLVATLHAGVASLGREACSE